MKEVSGLVSRESLDMPPFSGGVLLDGLVLGDSSSLSRGIGLSRFGAKVDGYKHGLRFPIGLGRLRKTGLFRDSGLVLRPNS